MFRLPPTSATTCLPEATAPTRFVSPPDRTVNMSPATVCVFAHVVESPSALPRLPDALAVNEMPLVERAEIDTPTPALAPLLLLRWLPVFCAA